MKESCFNKAMLRWAFRAAVFSLAACDGSGSKGDGDAQGDDVPDVGPTDARDQDALPPDAVDFQDQDPDTDNAGDTHEDEDGEEPPDRCGAEGNPTGNPIGGGEGYSDIPDPAGADFNVSTVEDLLGALAAAGTGQVIYLDDGAELDMTDHWNVQIPDGVTLASGRGRDGSQGALIKTDHLSGYPACYDDERRCYWDFMLLGEGSRVTGIILQGPDGEIRWVGYNDWAWPTGLKAYGVDNTEVDNCEFRNWPEAAVALWSSAGNHVHHNYFHHNRRRGFGYGVENGGSDALIEGNLFDYYRHAVEGSRGYPVTSYEARYNIVLGNDMYQHAFDMHGGNDCDYLTADDPAACPEYSLWWTVPAGGTILIHHNTIYPSTRVLEDPGTEIVTKEAVNIRGIPSDEDPSQGAIVYKNWALHDPADGWTMEEVFRQSVDNLEGYEQGQYYNMQVYDNCLGPEPPP
jgi:hypothetical protein